MQQLQRPPIADDELYVGALTDESGELYHLILLPGDNDDANWQTQMDWAKSIGGDLPNRIEQAMLFAYQKAQFQEDYYWSNTQHASDSDYAWIQSFSYGIQISITKSAERRARAVRRLPI